jgi:hypothetical protein
LFGDAQSGRATVFDSLFARPSQTCVANRLLGRRCECGKKLLNEREGTEFLCRAKERREPSVGIELNYSCLI